MEKILIAMSGYRLLCNTKAQDVGRLRQIQKSIYFVDLSNFKKL